MSFQREPARVNVKLVLILSAVVLALGAGLFAAREIRRSLIKRDALAAGAAAFEQGDWEAACQQYQRYLEKDQKNAQVFERFARAQLNRRPTSLENIHAAIWAYRRLLGLQPDSTTCYEALAELYIATQNANELAYIGRRMSERRPDDPRGPLWLAASLLSQQKLDEARRLLESLTTRLQDANLCPPEYLDACAVLSAIEMRSESTNRAERGRFWLDQAVAHAPDSAYARLNRARFFRRAAETEPIKRSMFLELARADLDVAENHAGRDARDLLNLVQEWIAWDDLDRAAAGLAEIENIADEDVRRRFADPDDWISAIFLVKADLALRKGDGSSCAALADDVLQKLKYPIQRQRVLPTVVRLYVAAQRLDHAKQSLDEFRKNAAPVMRDDALDESTALLTASIALAEGKPFDVIASLQSYLRRDPRDPAVLQLLADAYQATGRPRLAEKAIQRYFARTDPARDPASALGQARLYLRSGRPAEALRLLQILPMGNLDSVLIRIEAELADARLTNPTVFEQTARGALDEARRLANANPERAEAALLLASIQAELGNRTDAVRTLREAAERLDNALSVELALVQLHLASDDPDAALDAAQRLRARFPEDPRAWIAGAIVLERKEQTADARNLLAEGALKVSQGAARREIELQLARFDLAHDLRPQAIERLEALADADPADIPSRALLLDQPEYAADESRARRRIDELKSIEGEQGCIWRVCQAAILLAGTNWRDQQAQIQQLLGSCLETDPGYPAAVLLMGELLERLGQFPAAESLYQRALVDNPLAADVAERLISLLQKQSRHDDVRRLLDRFPAATAFSQAALTGMPLGGNLDEALQTLRRRLESDPKDVDALVTLAWLTYRHTGNPDDALRMLETSTVDSERAIDVAAVQAAILEKAGLAEKLRALLDQFVARRPSFESYHLRATFLFRLGDFEAAEADCRRLTAYEDRPEGFLQLGMFYADTGRLDDAVNAWQNGLENYPEYIPLKTRLMTGLLERDSQSDREQGLKLLDELTSQSPDDPHLLGVRALLRLRDGSPAALQEAESLLLRVVDLRPSAVDAHLKLVQLALRAGDMQAVRERLALALQANPESNALVLLRADVEAQGGNTTSAAALTRSVLEREPRNTDALHLFARLAVHSAEGALLTEAARRLQPIVENPSAESRLLIDLASVYAALDRQDQALSLLDRVPDQIAARDRAALLTLRIEMFTRTLNFDAIQALLPELTAAGVLFPEPLMLAVAALTGAPERRHRDAALHALETLLASPEISDDFRMDIAGIYYQSGEIERAADVYEGILVANPDQPRACNDLAWILAQNKKEYPRALELTQRGLQTAPPNLRLNLLDTRGVILMQMNRYEDARRDFAELVKNVGLNSSAHPRACLQLARACSSLNDESGMRAALQEALESDRRLKTLTEEERSEIDRLRRQIGG